MCGNTKGYKHCHKNVSKHKLIQILSPECVETQTDTNTVTGMCGNTKPYKYCHRNVWKHKTIQILSLEFVETQNNTNTVQECVETKQYKYCHRNVPASSPFLPNQLTLEPAPNTTPPAA